MPCNEYEADLAEFLSIGALTLMGQADEIVARTKLTVSSKAKLRVPERWIKDQSRERSPASALEGEPVPLFSSGMDRLGNNEAENERAAGFASGSAIYDRNKNRIEIRAFLLDGRPPRCKAEAVCERVMELGWSLSLAA